MELLYNGIDVSRWQGAIDWRKVKAAGIEFVMIRAGYCSYTGQLTKDLKFDVNIKGAREAGVYAGVYLYSYAKTADAAKTAAGQLLDLIQGYELHFPVAFDVEDTIHLAMSKADNTAITKAFLDKIASGGYLPVLYTYKSFAENYLDMSRLSDYDFWVAHIAAKTNYTGSYTMWQYSWTGKVNGIGADVAMNYCYKDYPALIVQQGLNSFDAAQGGNGQDNTGSDYLEVDEGGTTGTGETDTGAADPELPAENKGIKYVVVKNDNLTHIAQRFGIPLRLLIQENPQIKNQNLIYVGQVIHIPPKLAK